MKFVVKKNYFDEVEVTLPWETKDKIKKIVFWGIVVPVGCISGVSLRKQHNANKE